MKPQRGGDIDVADAVAVGHVERLLARQMMRHAAQAAADMQSLITAEPPIETQRLTLRVGFHFGPALETGGDVFGDSVNVAARLVGVAHGTQVITSAATVSALSPSRFPGRSERGQGLLLLGR